METYEGKHFEWKYMGKKCGAEIDGDIKPAHLPILDIYDKELSNIPFICSTVITFLDNEEHVYYHALRIENDKTLNNEIPTSTEPEE